MFVFFSRFYYNYVTKESDVHWKMLTYRHIQLLATLSNEIQQKWVIPGSILISTVVFGFSLAFVVKIPAEKENIPGLGLMFLLCLDTGIFLLLCLGTFADVYKQSKLTSQKLRADLANIVGKSRSKWAQRFLKSCGVIKMKFGGNNFVEELTPLNCLHHGLEMSVQIILLWRI